MLNGVDAPKYFMDTTKLYKIWFSKNPDVFMDDLNKLRLIKFRVHNPRATIVLVYSSRCLSQKAKLELIEFTKKLGVDILDFDTSVRALLESELDQKLYAIASLEIDNTLSNSGGNLAGASDNTRAILGLIRKLGSYSDCDVHINFGQLAKAFRVNTSCVLTSGMLDLGADFGTPLPALNNDFFAITYDSASLDNISPEALRKVTALQMRIITNYEKNFSQSLTEDLPGLLSKVCIFEGAEEFIKNYFSKPNATLFNFRTFVSNLSVSDLPEGMQEVMCEEGSEDFTNFKHMLYSNTICNISGPISCIALFLDEDKTKFRMELDEETIRIEPAAQWETFSTAVVAHGTDSNALREAVFSQQNPRVLSAGFKQMNEEGSANFSLQDMPGRFNDASWSILGAAHLQKSSATIDQSVRLIQSAILGRNSRKHFKLSLEQRNIASVDPKKRNAEKQLTPNDLGEEDDNPLDQLKSRRQTLL